MKIKFVEKAKLWISISLIIIIIGIVFIFASGLNLGVDFSGGSLLYVNIGENYNVNDIKGILNANGVAPDVVQAGENNQDVIIRIKHMDNLAEVQKKITQDIQAKYNLKADQFSADTVGAVIGSELVRNAIISILIASALILGYIWIRFELLSGVAAIIALLHDVAIMFAVMAIFRIPINSSFVAAMLTIIGYSINDTIIVFDRIRENQKRFGRKNSRGEVVNQSINETLVRSLNTSLTTLFTITVVYLLGVQSIKEFALPLIAGIISGTYSSIFIASPIWVWWNEMAANKKLAANK